MSREKIIRAWKEEFYLISLTDEERRQLPPNPAGSLAESIELSDEMLGYVKGAQGPTAYARPRILQTILLCVNSVDCILND